MRKCPRCRSYTSGLYGDAHECQFSERWRLHFERLRVDTITYKSGFFSLPKSLKQPVVRFRLLAPLGRKERKFLARVELHPSGEVCQIECGGDTIRGILASQGRVVVLRRVVNPKGSWVNQVSYE